MLFTVFTGKPLDPTMPVVHTVSSVICSVIFGHRFFKDDENFQRLIESIDTIAAFVNSISFFVRRIFCLFTLYRQWKRQLACYFYKKNSHSSATGIVHISTSRCLIQNLFQLSMMRRSTGISFGWWAGMETQRLQHVWERYKGLAVQLPVQLQCLKLWWQLSRKIQVKISEKLWNRLILNSVWQSGFFHCIKPCDCQARSRGIWVFTPSLLLANFIVEQL